MIETEPLWRIVVEVFSAFLCGVLVRFMIKPYLLTREGRYLGLPLGFSFLGTSYAIAAIAYTEPAHFFNQLLWLQFVARTFSFVFLAVTYYFSKSPSKNSRLCWDIALGVLVAALIILLPVAIIAPQAASSTYSAIQAYVRVFNIICLAYVAFHTLRSHIKNPDPATIWIPLGFGLLALSQYSLLFWYTDSSLAAFAGGLALRLAALFVFLAVAYRTFFNSSKRIDT
jgi:hypothetical protein